MTDPIEVLEAELKLQPDVQYRRREFDLWVEPKAGGFAVRITDDRPPTGWQVHLGGTIANRYIQDPDETLEFARLALSDCCRLRDAQRRFTRQVHLERWDGKNWISIHRSVILPSINFRSWRSPKEQFFRNFVFACEHTQALL